MLDRRSFCSSASLVALAGFVPDRCLRAATTASRWPVPPQVRRVPATVGNFGHKRTDDYAWLKASDWQAVLRDPARIDPAIKAVIDAENAYADAMLAPTAPLQATLRKRAAEVLPGDDADAVALQDGGYVYFDREIAGTPYRRYLRRPAGGGAEQLLLDTAKRAAGARFYALSFGGPLHSPDQRLFGWAEDLAGSGIFRIRVVEIATGRMLVDDLDEGHGAFAFDRSGRYLYWVGRGASGNPNSVWRRDMRDGKDVRIHAEADAGFFIDVRTFASGAYVEIRLFNGAQNETRLIPSDDPTAVPIVVEPRTVGLRYTVDHWNGKLVILTDADDAPDMKIMTAPPATPGRAHWTELLPHRPGRFIAELHPFRGQLVREEWRDANPHLVAMYPDGREQDVPFTDAAYALEVPPHQGWDAPALVFLYQTPRLPPEQRRLAFATGKVAAAPARPNPRYDPQRYEVTRIEAPSSDGVRVPITLLRAKGAPRDGRAPLFLYAYGSYGAATQPVFDAGAIALVDQGWTYAIAHVRGGSERGTAWWRTVLTTGKKRTFEDFIASAEHLIAERYTAKKRIVAEGFSAGGLLVGAIYWMRPDLWAGVIGRAPFVDPLNDLDGLEGHPLGKTALPIWGDPRDPKVYDYILSYSPYDNLKRAPYPALLATGSLTDERVSYTDPLKFAVKARALTTGRDPIMVKITAVGGHVGGTDNLAALDRDAQFHAFAIWAADRRWGDVPQR